MFTEKEYLKYTEKEVAKLGGNTRFRVICRCDEATCGIGNEFTVNQTLDSAAKFIAEEKKNAILQIQVIK